VTRLALVFPQAVLELARMYYVKAAADWTIAARSEGPFPGSSKRVAMP